jgi:NAD(P)-dependent dehydrogenase (short-subunit alcohol dehydrogenase family)
MEFEGRAVIVTGAGNGLGRAYAHGLAKLGARVVVNDLGGRVDGSGSSHSAADTVVREIRDAGGEAVASYDSVATAEGGRNIVAVALDTYGKVDALINNAGIIRHKFFLDQTDEDLDLTLATHLKGSFYVSQPAFAAMRKQGYGRIVMISSSAMIGLPWTSVYAAAKGGVAGLMNAIAYDGAADGILCNALMPGAITRMGEGAGDPPPAFKPMYDAMLSIDGGLAPEFVAPMALFLASERCRSSGAIYSAIGGRYARVFLGLAKGWQSPTDAPVDLDTLVANLDLIDDLDGAYPAEDGVDELRQIGRKIAHVGRS